MRQAKDRELIDHATEIRCVPRLERASCWRKWQNEKSGMTAKVKRETPYGRAVLP